MLRVIVAHPHQQHSYRLATAMNEAGMLLSYVTTVYNKPGSLTRRIIPLLSGQSREKAEDRHCKELPDDKVKQIHEGYGLFYLLLMRLCHNNKKIMNPYNRFVSRKFGKKLAAFAIKSGADAVICYDTESAALFSTLKKRAPHLVRIMDVSAANKLYLKQIYEEDMKRLPEFANRLANERCDILGNKVSARAQMEMKSEIEDSDYFIIPSHFVEKSLAICNVKKEQLILCPYGVDVKAFQQKSYTTDKSEPINVIYVGGVKQLKGIGYLLKAFETIAPSTALLTIVGNADSAAPDIKPFAANVTFTGTVVHSAVPSLLQKADVFVFPSLGDSFALAALEGTAVGLPIIASENTGMVDEMTDGVEGFIIPVGSDEAIKEKILWFAAHRNEMQAMGESARKMACRLSWERYYTLVASSVRKAVLEKQKTAEVSE